MFWYSYSLQVASQFCNQFQSGHFFSLRTANFCGMDMIHIYMHFMERASPENYLYHLVRHNFKVYLVFGLLIHLASWLFYDHLTIWNFNISFVYVNKFTIFKMAHCFSMLFDGTISIIFVGGIFDFRAAVCFLIRSLYSHPSSRLILVFLCKDVAFSMHSLCMGMVHG